MKTVGPFEAKSRFSAVIAAVERGDSIVVTKKRKPVARIVPYAGPIVARESGFDDGLGWMAGDFNDLPAKLADAGRR